MVWPVIIGVLDPALGDGEVKRGMGLSHGL